jgi:hypothetical protein
MVTKNNAFLATNQLKFTQNEKKKNRRQSFIRAVCGLIRSYNPPPTSNAKAAVLIDLPLSFSPRENH